ncbi:MAG: hypothetical protein AAF310_06460, partial [Myxococcota bacterium]
RFVDVVDGDGVGGRIIGATRNRGVVDLDGDIEAGVGLEVECGPGDQFQVATVDPIALLIKRFLLRNLLMLVVRSR